MAYSHQLMMLENIIYNMKYIKKYEKFQTAMTIEYDDKVFWIIYGDAKIIFNVLETIIESRFSFNHFWVSLENVLNHFKRAINDDIKIVGTFILSTPQRGGNVPHPSFLSFKNEEEKNMYIETYLNRDYIFKGELKVDNGDVILDTIEVDINKYNL